VENSASDLLFEIRPKKGKEKKRKKKKKKKENNIDDNHSPAFRNTDCSPITQPLAPQSHADAFTATTTANARMEQFTIPTTA